MNSCPKCGSVKILKRMKVYTCQNPVCKYKGSPKAFEGLQGRERPKEPQLRLGGGAIWKQPKRNLDDLDDMGD